MGKKDVMSSALIVDENNIYQVVQKHDENIKSNQHRLDEVEDNLCKKTEELSAKLDKLNNKQWLTLLIIAGYAGQNIISALLSIGG